MTVINFIWDELSDNVLMETDISDDVVVEYTNAPYQFGEPISSRRDEKERYFSYDGTGSTRNLTAENQAITDTYVYSAFGELIASSGLTYNPFQFNGMIGYYTDTQTDSTYVRRRTYDPSLARWLTRDPLGFINGPGLYLYVGNQVPNNVDPTGTVKADAGFAASSRASAAVSNPNNLQRPRLAYYG